MFNATSTSPLAIVNVAVARLLALRKALSDVSDLQQWLAGQIDADLTSLGFDAADLAALRKAVGDADALGDLYRTGLPPSTYPQPPSAHAYGDSQRVVIGPQ